MTSLNAIIKQMILSAFRSANMTSASPGHINHFIGIESQGGMDIIGSEEELDNAIREIVGTLVTDGETGDTITASLEESGEKTGKKKGSLEKQGAQTISSLTSSSPTSIVATGIQYLPHAVLITLAISLAPLIFDILTKPGGPLDLRFRRIIDDEINGFLSRQTQKDTEMGVRQVIIQSKIGFTASNGLNNYNTMKGIREGGINKERLDRFGMIDHSKGVFDFG